MKSSEENFSAIVLLLIANIVITAIVTSVIIWVNKIQINLLFIIFLNFFICYCGFFAYRISGFKCYINLYLFVGEFICGDYFFML